MFPQCLTALFGLMVATLVALAARAVPDAGRASWAALASVGVDPESAASASERAAKRLVLRTLLGAAAALNQAENASDSQGQLALDASLASARLALRREPLTRAPLNAPPPALIRRTLWAPAGARPPPRA